MKRYSLQCAAIAGLLGALGFVTYVNGDGKAGGRAARPPLAIRVALVDTAHILKNYERYEDLQQEVREAAEAAQNRAKEMIEQARSIQGQLQSGEIEDGSEEFFKKERQVISLSSKLEVYNAMKKKELKKKDVETLAAVYQDVQKALAVYAEQNDYTMILRFTRDFEEFDEKQRTAQVLNQNIIYREGADDITDGVLTYLNQQYRGPQTAAARKPAPAAKTPASNPSSTPSAVRPASARKPQAPASGKATR